MAMEKLPPTQVSTEILPDNVEQAIKDRLPDDPTVSQWLHSGNVNAQNRAGETALHLAAQYNNGDVCDELLKAGADMEKQNDKGNTPVHDAAVSGHTKIVQKFIAKEPNCVTLKDNADKTPLHLAAEGGRLETVDYILSHAHPDVNARSNDDETPLHSAVSVAYPGRVNPIAKLLIARGASVNPDPSNVRRSPFEAASVDYGYIDLALFLLDKGAKVTPRIFMEIVEAGNETIAKAIVESEQWNIVLRGRKEHPERSFYSCQKEFTTPFRLLIEKMPAVAKIVLDKCTVPGEDKDNPYSTNYKVKFNYEFFEDQDGEEENPQSPWDLAYPSDYASLNKPDPEHPIPKWGPKGFNKFNHPLEIMVRKKRVDLLNHPVVGSLIHRKWIRFGIWYYFINLFLYAVFLALLTTFALIVPRPHFVDCQSAGAAIAPNCPGLFVSNFTPAVIAALVILLAVFRLVVEVAQLITQRLYYFTEWVNWIEVPLYIFSIIFVSMPNWSCPCVLDWQWQVGVVAVLLGWFNFIMFTSKFPIFGIYVLMFIEICKTFLKTVVLSLLLIVLFGLAFFMIFSDQNALRSPFVSPIRSMLKVMTMTTGELDYDDIFRLDPSGGNNNDPELEYLPMSYILWIPFVILMPVLFLNLLTGLAVGDTNDVRRDAEIHVLSLQVDQILTVEGLWLKRYRRRNRKFLIVSPNKKYEGKRLQKFWEKTLKFITWEGVRYDKRENIISVLPPAEDDSVQLQTSHMRHIREHISDAAPKWREIGLKLGLTNLDAMSGSDPMKLNDVLTDWIDTQTASIDQLLEVLRSADVDRSDLADKIEGLIGDDRKKVGLKLD